MAQAVLGAHVVFRPHGLLNRKIVEQSRKCAICPEEFTDYNDIVPDHKERKGTTSYTRCSMRIPGVKSCYVWQNVILYRTGTNLHFATTAPRLKRLPRKPGWQGKRGKASNRP
jgi:hypothetical protein